MKHCNTIQSTYYAVLHPPPALARSASTAAGWRTWILLLYCSAFAADTQTYTLHRQNKSNMKTFANSCSPHPHPPRGTAKLVYLISRVYPPFNIKTILQSRVLYSVYNLSQDLSPHRAECRRCGRCPPSRLPRTSVGVLQVPGENTCSLHGDREIIIHNGNNAKVSTSTVLWSMNIWFGQNHATEQTFVFLLLLM